MDINFEYYKIFYFVAKNQSFTKAAEKLYVSQPAITQNIKKLEDDLGRKLFYRNNKGIKLTEEGKNLYNYLQSSIEILSNAEDKFKQYANMETGSIRIRTGRTNGRTILYEPLKEFMRLYPKIDVELTLGSYKESLNLLNNGEIDLVILNIPFDVELQNVEIMNVVEKEYVFAMTKKYKEANNVKIEKITDINNYNLIASPKDTTYRRVLDKYLEKNQKLNIKYQIMLESLKKELLLDDLGIAFLRKDEIQEQIDNGTVEVLDIFDEPMNSEIGMAVMKKDIRSFAVQKLLELIKKTNKTK